MSDKAHGEAYPGLADLEQLVDREALLSGGLPLNPVFETVAEDLDGEDPASAAGVGPTFRDALNAVLFRLLQLSVHDPEALDVLAVKMLDPTATHETIRLSLNALGRRRYGHRARICELAKRLVRRCPEFAGVMIFDSRGGDRHSPMVRHASGRRLRADLEALQAAEASRSVDQRRAIEGPGGLLDELAERHGILGADGTPSWSAVKDLIGQAAKRARN